MSPCNHAHSGNGLHTFERGGLTASPSPCTTAVARFGYCEHCDVEVPVDDEGLCTYCFDTVPEEDE